MPEHIKVGDVTPRIQYTANGALTTFFFSFPIFEDADIEVYSDSVLKTLNTDYTVHGAGASGGGSVTFRTPPPGGTVITLRRNIAIRRTSDFQQSGVLRARVLNDELDRMTAEIQQVDDQTRRSLHLKSFDAGGVMELPAKSDRAGKVLAFDAGGKPAASASTLTVIETGAIIAADGAVRADNARVAAETARDLARGSETNAASSASEARGHAQAAAESNASKLYSRIETRSGDFTVLGNENGKLFVVDTANGNVVVTLPNIADEVQEGFRIGFVKSGSGNTLTIAKAGDDTINGSASYVMTSDTEFTSVVADDDTIDNWITFGASALQAGAGLSRVGSSIKLSGNVDIDDNGNLHGHGTQFNLQTGVAYTLQNSDNGKIIELENASPVVVTLPNNAADNTLNMGFQCTLIRKGEGRVSVAAQGTDVIHSKESKLDLSARYSAAYITKRTYGASSEWYLAGDLS